MQNSRIRCLGRFAALGSLWTLVGSFTAWAFGALHFDSSMMRGGRSWCFIVAVVASLVVVRGVWNKLALVTAACVLVLAWWLTLQPSNDRHWQPDVAEVAWAGVDGDVVTLHNVRNCDYRTEQDFTPRWETRTMKLSHITGVDLFINYWGSRWIAHPIASFQFSDSPPLCFSIEARKELGESYSAIGGFYRQYELICIASDERDLIRLRTNYRKGEESFLYRTKLSAARARERFLEYLATINDLRDKPRWYNALTTNCTTSIRTQHPAGERMPWDWRLLVNGKSDEMLFERNLIDTGGLGFEELRAKACVNEAARRADTASDFSQLIRAGRPGFASTPISIAQP